MLWSAAPAAAQDASTLVSNIGVSGSASSNLAGWAFGTGFRTGSSTHGYHIKNIKAVVSINPTALTDAQLATVRAELWINSDNVSLRPYAKLDGADLTVPDDLKTVGNHRTVTFGGNNVVLEPNGIYHLVIYSTGSLATMYVTVTAQDGEDAGAATGWSILDNLKAYSRNVPGAAGGSWQSNANVMKFAVEGTARTQLGTPANVARKPGDGRITVSWDAVEHADRYVVEYGVAGSGVSEKVTVDGATSRAVTGLDNGTAYTFRVQAQHSDNAHADGPWSAWGQATPALPAPTDLDLGPAVGSLALSWTAPVGTVTGYDVHYTSAAASGQGAVGDDAAVQTGSSPSAADGWVDAEHSGTDAALTISGLADGTAYRVRVRAVNAGGSSAWARGTATTAPVTPTLTVRRGDGRFTVTWTAVAAARGYEVGTTTVGVQGEAIQFAQRGSVGTTVTRGPGGTAITNGTVYSLRLRACTVVETIAGRLSCTGGISAWSAAQTVTAGPPSMPANFAVSAGSGAFTATWSAVTGAGSYGIDIARGDGTSLGAIPVTPGTATSRTVRSAHIIGNPGNGSALRVRMQACWGTNYFRCSSGVLSPWTEWVPVTLGAPATIAAPGVAAGEGSLEVTWTAPGGNGASVTGYDVHYTSAPGSGAGAVGGHAAASGSDASAGWVDAGHMGTAASHTVSGLAGGTAYRVRVRGVNSRGNGAWAHGSGTPRGIPSPPSAPVGLTVTPGSARLTLGWTAPSGPLTGYEVHYTSAAVGTVADDADASGSNASAAWVAASRAGLGTTAQQVIASLTNNTRYRVRVRGVNAVGDGAWAWGGGTPKASRTGSTDATLSALSMKDAGDNAISFEETFASTTYAYTASVPAEATPVKVTPTVNDTTATVKVGMGTSLTAVTSGSASGAVALDYGSNAVAVEVTAAAGNTRTYTITVNRALPEVDFGFPIQQTSESQTSYQVRIESSAANPAISGTISYAAGTTHPASLSDDLGSGRPTTFTIPSGDDVLVTVPIVDDALNEEDETFTITVEAGTGYTVGSDATATITITDDDPPAAPGSPSAAAGNGKLTVSWTKPAGPVDGYQLRYKTKAAPDSAVTDGSGNASKGWVSGGTAAGADVSAEITGLTNDTVYAVAVRATDGQTASGNGYGPWTASAEGTPKLGKQFNFHVAATEFPPGIDGDLTVALTEAAPSGGLALTVTPLFGQDLPENLCGTTALATAADIGSSPPAAVTVDGTETEKQFQFPIADNGDDLVGGMECFGIRLGTSVSGWTAGENAVVKVTVARGQGRIAFGRDAAATAKLTASVAETVSGGTLSVPLTVDHLPSAATTFTVGVLSGGTATEWTSTTNPGDFRIATKTVEFGPSTSKTLNLAVTITNDLEVEADETIELGIVAAPNNDPTFNKNYGRHAQARLATVTITSEDAVPGKVTELAAAADSAKLDVSWTAPASAGSSALTGYDVHYTSAPKTGNGAVADGAAAAGSNAAAAWVDAGHSGTDPDDELTGLANGTEYRVRVRAENAVGAGAWEFTTGTPRVAPSSNANLSALAASGAAGATATFSALTLSPSFSAATTSYSASVPHATTHAKLTPAAAHSGAAVTVDGAAVASGSSSGAIALAVGANAIAVAVTPETGAADRKTYTVTITRAPPPPGVSLSASPNPVGEGADVTVTATLTGALAADVTIPLTVGGGTAESGDHGTLASITVRAGSTSGSGTISTAADEDADDETFTVSLGTLPPEVVAGTPSSVEVRITEDEPGPARVRLEVSPNPASEDAGPVTLTARLTRAAPAGGATVVFYQTGGTAYPVVDYAFDPPAGGTSHGETAEIAVAAGARAAAARLVLVDDDLAEGDETVVLAARSSAASAPSGSVTLVIEDDEGATEATIEASPEEFGEGEETEVTVFLTQPAAGLLEIPLDVTFVTAEREDVRGPWTVLVHPGERWGSTVFEAMQDDDDEDETFTVALDPDELPAPLVAGDPSEAELTIIDDDGTTVTIEARPNPVAEGEDVTVTARLSEAAGADLAIPVTVARGSSEAGDHGTLESIGIARGRTSGSGTVATHADADADDETFTVELGTLPDGLSAGEPSEVEVVIEDPDGKAPGAVRSLAVAAGERTTLDVTWQAPAEGSVTGYDVHYTSSSTVADGAPCCAPADAGWADAGHSGTDPSHTVERLNDGTRYRVRVRAKNAGGAGEWSFGAGTTRQPAGSSVDLTALVVTAADSANGTYSALTLVPSFSPSVTTYEAAAPRSRTHLKIRPTARDPSAEIIAHGHLMASGATTPALPISAGVFYIAVSNASGHYKEYVVEVYAAQSSSASQAARSAARSVTRAAADARAAALALLGGVGPDDAAEALLGGRGLGADRLEALDRLGNANGRYDVGDLLAWIERCESGRARCGDDPKAPKPASDAALPGAFGAAAKRPRGRGAGPGRPKRRRRWRGLLPLLAVVLWSCDGGVGLTDPAVPEPGYLSVGWTAPPGGPAAAGALVEIDGPHVGEVRAPGLDLYGSGQGGGPRRFVVAGDLGGGPVIEFRVPDRRQAHLYSVRVLEVAAQDHRLLDADDYRAAVTR